VSSMTVTQRVSSSARRKAGHAALTMKLHRDDGSPFTARASRHVVCKHHLDKQHSIDTTVEVGVIGDLRILCPDDLARLRHEAQL